MVSNTSDDLPEPLTPVNTVILCLGMSSETSLRLCSRAPRTSMNRRSPMRSSWRLRTGFMWRRARDTRDAKWVRTYSDVFLRAAFLLRSQRTDGPVFGLGLLTAFAAGFQECGPAGPVELINADTRSLFIGR